MCFRCGCNFEIDGQKDEQTGRRMNRQMDGKRWTEGCTDGQKDEQTDERKDEQGDGQKDEQTDGRKDEQMDGKVNRWAEG